MSNTGPLGRLFRIRTDREPIGAKLTYLASLSLAVCLCAVSSSTVRSDSGQWWALGTFIQPLNGKAQLDGHKERLNAFLQQGRTLDALRLLDGRIAERPNAPAGYWQRGLLLLGVQDFRRALNDFDMVVKLSPHTVGAHMKRGLLLAKVNRPGEALKAYDSAIGSAKRRYAEIADYWSASVYAKSSPGVVKTTLELIARERDLTILHAHLGKGQVHFARSSYDDAEKAYGAAIAAVPGHGLPYKYRGWLKEKTGHLHQARSDYRRAAELNGDDKWVISALKRIR